MSLSDQLNQHLMAFVNSGGQRKPPPEVEYDTCHIFVFFPQAKALGQYGMIPTRSTSMMADIKTRSIEARREVLRAERRHGKRFAHCYVCRKRIESSRDLQYAPILLEKFNSETVVLEGTQETVQLDLQPRGAFLIPHCSSSACTKAIGVSGAVGKSKGASCKQCGAAHADHRCPRCHHAFYCDRACRQRHWKAHKKICRQVQAAYC